MKLVVPYNWDASLIGALDCGAVDALYAKARTDEYGGGRPACILPETDSGMIAEHVGKARAKGIGFNYLLNASCLGNAPIDGAFASRLRSLLDFLCGAGITGVTVTDERILRLVKKHYPFLKISLSLFAMVTTVAQARYYEDLGVTDMLLNNPNDFEFIRAVREAVSCNIIMLANLGCNFFCNVGMMHSFFDSHASQSGHRSSKTFLDHHIMMCSIRKLQNLESVLKTSFVRPEDAYLYESLGVGKLKLVDRSSPTERIIEYVEAYKNRSYPGDFLRLVNVFGFVNKTGIALPKPSLKRALEHAGELKVLFGVMGIKPFDIYIDNSALSGMKEEIMKSGVDCRATPCAECGICRKYFEASARYSKSELEATIESLCRLRDSLTSSRALKILPF